MFPFSEIPLEKKGPTFQLYDQIQNPIIFSKNINDDYPPFLSNFPSPFFDDHDLLPLNQILPNFNPKPTPNPNPTTLNLPSNPPNPTKKEVAPRRRSVQAAAPRKRIGKKDRHSKIFTAQGIRDRRMRLSLQVARKFFDLQDMLGYDKASKTIEWLFNKSKKAIKDLADLRDHRGGGGAAAAAAADTNNNNNNLINVSILSDGKSESFVSECEVLSGIEENCEVKEDSDHDANGSRSFEKKRAVCKPKSRESREKARARARSRTEEKMMMMMEGNQRGLGSPFVDQGDAADYSPLLHPPSSDVGTIEKLLGSTSSSSSDFANTLGFLGSNWDLLSNDKMMMVSSSSISTNEAAAAAAAAGNPDFPFFHQ